MSSAAIGILAEDATDGETVKILIQRLRPDCSVKTRQGGGCGEIRRKGAAWAKDLVHLGCTALVIACDLDRDEQGRLCDEAALRRRLESVAWPGSLRRHLCIAIEEIEAWFWTDQALLDRIGSPGAACAHHQPRRIPQPKEALIRLSRDGRQRPRYATTENPRLARDLDLHACAARCPEFRALRDFVAGL